LKNWYKQKKIKKVPIWGSREFFFIFIVKIIKIIKINKDKNNE